MLDIFYLDGTVKKASPDQLGRIKSHPVWIDAASLTKEETQSLQENFQLHSLTAEDIYNDRSRIKVEEFDEYLFCIFYRIEKHKAIELFEMDFIIGKNFIISNHRKPIASFSQLKEDPKRLEALFRKGPDYLFHRLLDIEIDNFFPVLESIDDSITKIEDRITGHPQPDIQKSILRIKRQLRHIKKVTLPQREKIGFLAKSEYKQLSRKSIPFFRDIYDHAIRVSDTVETYREAISATYEMYMSAVSNSMNETMKVLSIIATIALPLTVISGIYGTNFTNLPGSGVTYGFWIMVGFMALMCITMIIFFRRRGWF